MSKERFRPSYNIFGNNNNSTVVKEEESESVSPFNIQLLQTKQESYTSPILDLSESISLQSETNFFESASESVSPFRIIQYAEGETPHEIANRLTKGKPYVPGELSKRYQALSPQECTKVAQEVNQRFRKLIGNNNLVLDPKNPKDRPLQTLWLQLRDQVMSERSKTSREPIAPPVLKPQTLSVTTKFMNKSPCLELTTIDDPSKSKFPYQAGFYEYNEKDAKGCAYYPAELAALNSPFHATLKRKVPIVFIAPGKPWYSYYDPNIKRENELIKIQLWSKLLLGPKEKGQPPPQGWKQIVTYKGFEYFQQKLAKLGIIAVCVDFASADEDEKFYYLPAGELVERRRELIVDSIKYFMKQNTDPNSPFYNHIDFQSVGLMGHSQGGEGAILVEERKDPIITSGSVRIRGILALAPSDVGCFANPPNCSSVKYSGFAFMTILPAGDGDTFNNDGSKFYDRAIPERFKIQLYVHGANHNYFNSQWLFWDDSYGSNPFSETPEGKGKKLLTFDTKLKLPLPIMTPGEHQQVLSVYGCAFFRRVLQFDNYMNLILNHWRIPDGVKSNNIRFSFQWNNAVTVDNHEQPGGIRFNTLGGSTSSVGSKANENALKQDPDPTFINSFFGDTTGMIIMGKGIFFSHFYKEIKGKTIYRSELKKVARDLTNKDVYIRAAEVYLFDKPDDIKTGFKDKDRLGFELGLRDINNFRLWVHSDAVGGLSRPYYRGHPSFSTNNFYMTKTMLETLRFPSECFKRQDPRLEIKNIISILIRTDLVGNRQLAFDDLQIM